MPRFLLIFRGGAVVNATMPPVDRACADRALGRVDALVAERGSPRSVPLGNGARIAGAKRNVTPDAPADKDLVTGTYFVAADSLQAATELAAGCPILDVDGSVEVRPLLERPE